MTKAMGHVEELRQVASLDQCAWDYAQKLMRSSADEIERLDADAAGAQAELASVKACWAEALENVATRNREIEQLRQERHQLRNELTAAGLEGEQLRAAMRKALNVWDNYRITDTETEQAIKAECEALVGAAAEPGVAPVVSPSHSLIALYAGCLCEWCKNERAKSALKSADQWTPEQMAAFQGRQAASLCQGCFRPVSACVCASMKSNAVNCNCPNGSYGKKHRDDCPARTNPLP